MISVGSEVQVLPGPPSYFGGAEMRSPGRIEKRCAMRCIAARYRVSGALFVCPGGAVGILSRGGVAQWESTCFASRGSSVRIRPSPFSFAVGCGERKSAGGREKRSAAHCVAARSAAGDDGLKPGALRRGVWRHFQNCFVPRWRSGILEREPGGRRSGMFFHMVKMISCVCE